MKTSLLIPIIFAAGCAAPVKPLEAIRPRLGPAPLIIYVGGELRRPGQYAWTNGITAADAIQLAGGFTDFVPSRRLFIDHWDGSREEYRLTRDYRLKQNVVLKPGDRVYTMRW